LHDLPAEEILKEVDGRKAAGGMRHFTGE